MRIVHVIVLMTIVLAVVFLMRPTNRQSLVLAIDGASLWNEHYAIVQTQPSGDVLFFGSVNGGKQVAVSTRGNFGSPYIASSNKVLVAEGVPDGPQHYRLLEVEIDGPSVICHSLVESAKHIAAPIVLSGPRSGEVLFFSGEFNPEAVGIPVIDNKLTNLKDGRIEFFNGPTFLTVGRPVEVTEGRFVAPASMIRTGQTTWIDLRENTELADIHIVGNKMEAKPFFVSNGPIRNVSKVTSQVETGEVFVVSTEFYAPPDYFVDRIEYSSGIRQKTIALPQGRYYSAVFSNLQGDGPRLQILSVGADDESRGHTFTVSDLVGDAVVDKTKIRVDQEVAYDTSGCSSRGVTF